MPYSSKGEGEKLPALVSTETQRFQYYSVDTKGEKKHYAEGYIATYHKDLVDDVITKSGMRMIYDRAEELTMDLEHEAFTSDDNGYGVYGTRSALIPVAKVVEKRLDDVGVWVKAELNSNLDRFKTIWKSIKEGFIKGFSIAFDSPDKNDYIIRESDGARLLNKINMLNVALTGSPVNPHATITNVVMKNRLEAFKVSESEEKLKLIKDILSEPEVKSGVEETIMSEEEKPLEAPVEDVPVEEPAPVVKAEEVEEAVSDGEESTELKSEVEKLKEEMAELKSLIASPKEEEPTVEDEDVEVKALREEVAELKAKLGKPVLKAEVEDAREAAPEDLGMAQFI